MGSQQHPARLPAGGGPTAWIPPKLPRVAQYGPATPTHAQIRPSSKQGGSASAPLGGCKEQGGSGDGVQQVWSWGVAPSGCPSPRRAGGGGCPRGRRDSACAGEVQSGRLPDCPGEIISSSPALFFFKAKIPEQNGIKMGLSPGSMSSLGRREVAHASRCSARCWIWLSRQPLTLHLQPSLGPLSIPPSLIQGTHGTTTAQPPW